MRFIFKLIMFVMGLIFLYMMLRWIGFDMQHFKELWDTIVMCLNDILHTTKDIL